MTSLHITIDKHIPPAGGLGGGSSDAATTLRLLQRAWPGVSDSDVLESALSVGSDEAFFLVGGTARAQGRGERVAALKALAPHGVVLFIAPETLERKTARLFAALAETRFDTGAEVEAFVRRLRTDSALRAGDLHNAFERVAFDEFPGLGEIKREIEGRIGGAVRLSGAGPTLFWIGPPGDEPAIAEAVRGLPCEVIPTRTAAAAG
jgi:4-diphosphocytidyl-2-C-methyl-D-erythritol kinase